MLVLLHAHRSHLMRKVPQSVRIGDCARLQSHALRAMVKVWAKVEPWG